MKKTIYALLFIGLIVFAVGWQNSSWDSPYTEEAGTRMSVFTYKDTMADDGTMNFPATATGDGIGIMKCGSSQDTLFIVSQGALNTLTATTLVTLTDTDNRVCLYQTGPTVVLKNRLGTTKPARVIYFY